MTGDGAVGPALGELLSDEGVESRYVPHIEDLLGSDDLTLVDLVIAGPDPGPGTAATRCLRAVAERVPVLYLVVDADAEAEERLLASGVTRVHRLGLGHRALRDELRSLLPAAHDRGKPSESRPVGGSAAMADLVAFAERVAVGNASLLLLGETGSGKEWLARRIHAASRRAEMPFVAVNCAAIPEGLAESELFGHEKGAFTGAVRSRKGHFQMAHGGTLFLDEIGDLPLSVQVRLLRVLQDGAFHPVGSETPVRVDVRTIAATHHALDEAVERGAFRRDLFYRLAVVSMHVPPLRDRPEDVVTLLDTYLEHFASRLDRPTPRFSLEATTVLLRYPWPGNVRELMNVVERAVLVGRGDVLGLEDLPAGFAGQGSSEMRGDRGDRALAAGPVPFRLARTEALEAFERRYLAELLEAVGGRVGEAAERAGMSQRALFNKMRRYGLKKEDFRH